MAYIKVSEYLNTLANKCGYLINENDDYFNQLLQWKIVEEKDKELLEDNLNYAYLNKTINRVTSNNKLIIKDSNDLVKKDDALEYIDKALKIINNKEFETTYIKEEKENVKNLKEYKYNSNILTTDENLKINDIIYLKEENKYKKVISKNNDLHYLTDATIDETLNKLKISSSEELNFDDAIIVNSENNETSYENTKLNLLASKRQSFSIDGYNISFTIKSSGLDIRVTKNTKNGLNAFFDASISNVKPSYNWDYEDGKLNNAYFKISYKMNNEIGVSTGKRKNTKINLENVDKSSLTSILKSTFSTSNNKAEHTIKICEIKTPIPNVPTAYVNLDVLLRIYISGKIEVVLYNSSNIGFEVDDGKLRMIHDVDRDIDAIIGATIQNTIAINFNLEAATFRLMDAELSFGIKASVTTTIHLYDSDGNMESINTDVTYDEIDELSKDNENIKVCGDVSFNWVLELQLNTSKSLLYKFGLNRSKEILNKNNQIFGNKTHIENWQFVDKCTRKNKTVLKTTSSNTNVNKISLSKYSIVINISNSVDVPIKALPSGYSKSDLVYTPVDNNIAYVENSKIIAKALGSTKIEIKTKDNKYSAYINVLVSTG